MEIKACRLCPRLCGAPRTAQEGEGFCKMGADAVVARAALHFWEEPCLSGTRGSGAVFFTGCSLGCVFCQNEQISTRREVGKCLDPEELSEVFLRLEEQGAHNINLVNPTHFAPAIAQALRLRRPSVPVVYNSGGYDRVETLRSLEGLIDIYLPDLKYVSPTLSLRYSGAENYPEAAKAAILEMLRQTGPPVLDEAGMMQKGTIVRHLVLPSNTRSTSEVLSWLSQLPAGSVLVSLMAQYVPCGRASLFPEINRRITRREYEKVQNLLFSLNLDGFVQERSSAVKDFIPPFNLEGLPS
ncbi:radical SAM protein [Anaeromassilibacillus sp. An200]|uniref:radical SAM protein n=1 Tax=Anaeromassilibacillus sp. An200 TaxID=1965587 RepID=UPI000B382149|nr:radical SAM protein [Anaeromassilibacillus sp. An200]OUP09016.1 radical SAM protein [Anaeromassilibacillus sp. An200]